MTVYNGMLGVGSFGELVLGESYFTVGALILDATDNPVTVLTYLGEQWVTERMGGTGDASVWLAWGTGEGIAVKSNTTLFTEDTNTSRTLATLSQSGTGQDALFTVSGSLVAPTNLEVTNVGIFTDSVGGDLLVHSSFDAKIFNSGDLVNFTFPMNPR